MSIDEADVGIVGAGPGGLYAATYVGLRGLRAVVLDTLPAPGGQITALYPEKRIHDVAGFRAVRGRELVERCTEQAEAAGARLVLNTRVETLRPDAQGFVLGTGAGAQVRCRAVIVAVGLGTFSPRRLPDAERFEGRGVHYVIRDPAAFRDVDLVIVGGGDAAVDWALELEDVARSVTLVHRRDRFRAHEGRVEQLLNSTVQVRTDAEVVHLHGDGELTGVEVMDKRTDEVQTLPATRLYGALGFHADLGPVSQWPIALDGRSIPVDRCMRTDLDGVFAAGDITGYEGKLKLISASFGEAVVAANHAANHVDPGLRVFPGYGGPRSQPVAAGTAR